MDDEELQLKIEQLRANRGGRTAEFAASKRESESARKPAREDTRRAERRSANPYEGYPFEEEDEQTTRPVREDGILGVITYQSILSVALAILFVLLMTFSPELSGGAVSEIKERTANDFSFRNNVYETVGNLLTYLNEIQPVDLAIPGTEDSVSTAATPESEANEAAGTVPKAETNSTAPNTGESNTGENGTNADRNTPDTSTDMAANTISGQASSMDDLTGQGGEFNPVEGKVLPSNVTFAPVVFTGQITFPIVNCGRITSGFGFREHPISSADEFHTALDVAAAKDTNILAAADGTVTISEESGSLGKHVVINHGNGFETVYGHCDKLIAKVGARIREGEVVAKVGNTGDSTGYHLHFGMKKNGLYFDPLCIFPDLELPDDVKAPPPAVSHD